MARNQLMSNLISLLSRGGPYGHYWIKQPRTTIWWDTACPPEPPDPDFDVYFGVHPSRARKSPSLRTNEGDISAINCLYADIDGKVFTGGKTEATEHIKELSVRPTVIIDSGGGYHCYWILQEPFVLDTPLKEEVAKDLQKRWVAFVGGDKAVHDLARVLRVPGTLNHKYDPPRHVRVVYENPDLLYALNALESLLPEDDHRGDDEDEDDGLVGTYPPATKPNKLTDKQIVDLARSSPQGPKFVSLWKGIDSGYGSQSEADLAFCCILAFWTGGDAERINHLFKLSKRFRPKWEREDYRQQTILRSLAQVTEYYTDPSGYLTAGADDEGNAQCVSARCSERFLFCEAFGWMEYHEGYWRTELAETALDRQIVKVLKERRAAAASAETTDLKQMEGIMRAARPSAANVRNCKTLLCSLLTVPTNSFDASLDELNCRNGVLDLSTGELSPHDSRKRFTYVIGVDYDPEADQTLWKEWLLEAVGGHQDVVDFLQVSLGYSITGWTREEALFYIYGPARAGKGVFTETIQAMLGGRPIATEVGMETFTERRRGSDQGFDLASLAACRFVAASESKAGQWLDGALIKRWTGGSPITCAHKYQRAFTYRPQFKIWMTSNFPLQMDPDDLASWTRPKVINFPKSYIGNEDKMLKMHMRSEETLQGVLAWAVEGAIQWYKLPKGGLIPPERIRRELEIAKLELDWVAKWVDEEVEITGDEKDKIASSDYYVRYRDWCEEGGAPEKKLKALNDSLYRLGADVRGKPFSINGRTHRGWRGARLRGNSFREDAAALVERSDLE